jgi:hypothetical protein
MDEDSQDYALKRPDGSFDFPSECTLATEEEAQAYVKQGKLRGISSDVSQVNVLWAGSAKRNQ